MNNRWIFQDGLSRVECTSFPYAFRTMHQAVKKGVEKGRKYNDMVKGMRIISPIKDLHGDLRTYSYDAATKMATDQGLLTVDGQINSREFKKKF